MARSEVWACDVCHGISYHPGGIYEAAPILIDNISPLLVVSGGGLAGCASSLVRYSVSPFLTKYGGKDYDICSDACLGKAVLSAACIAIVARVLSLSLDALTANAMGSALSNIGIASYTQWWKDNKEAPVTKRMNRIAQVGGSHEQCRKLEDDNAKD